LQTDIMELEGNTVAKVFSFFCNIFLNVLLERVSKFT